VCLTCEDPASTNAKFCGTAQVERAEKAYRVVQMKREGVTYPEIAEELNCALSTAHNLFKIGIKLMAPPDAAEEIMVLRVQLEQIYADIMGDLAGTTEPTEKAALYQTAMDNIKERRRLFGGADINIKHTVQSKFDGEMEDLVLKFQEDQDVRNAARARSRKAKR
jgi:hypothetical protein